MSRWVALLGLAVWGCSGDDGEDKDDTGNPGDDDIGDDDDDDDDNGDDDDDTDTDTGTLPEPVPETVRVRTYPDELPLIGVEVLISNADGSVFGLFVTDAAGDVVVDVPDGGSVTFAESYGGGSYLNTTFDIPDGSTVSFWSYRFYDTSYENNGPVYEITGSANQSLPGVSSWTFYTRCDGVNSNTPGPWTFNNAGCTDAGTDQLLVLGFNTSSELVAWGAIFDFPLVTDFIVSVPVTETDMISVPAEITGIPTGSNSVYMSLSPLHDGWRTYSASSSKQGGLAASEQVDLVVPALDYERYYLNTQVEVTAGTTCGRSQVALTPPLSVSFDVSAMALLSVDPVDLADPVQPAIHWVTTGGSRGDYGQSYLTWSNAADYHVWAATFDPTVRSSVQLPVLPAELVEFAFAPEIVAPVGVSFYDTDAIDGYAEVFEQSTLSPEEYTQEWSSGSGGDYLYF